jgi:hypothetical protein
METTGIRIESVERKSWILTGAFLILSLPFFSLAVVSGVALGALLAILNFRWLRDFAGRILSGSRPRAPKLLVLLYSLKYVFTALVIFLALKYDLANALAILAGVSVIILAISWEGAVFHRHMKEGADRAA